MPRRRMGSLGATLLAICSVPLLASAAEPGDAAPPRASVVPGRVVIKVQPGLPPLQPRDARFEADACVPGLAAFNALLGEAGARSIQPAFHADNAALAASIGLDRCYIIDIPPSADAGRLIASLAGLGELVRTAEPVYAGGPADLGPAGLELLPNDPFFGLQYALENVGQTIDGVPGRIDADIDAMAAWRVTRGAPHIFIAVLDSGVSMSHPDLAGQTVPGRNFTSSDAGAVADHWVGHGTHIAGIIAARTGNAVGVAGLAPDCRIMPLRVTDRFGFTSEQWLADAIVWGTDHGASVMNISLAFTSASALQRDAVRYAYESGVVLCASSGNIPTDPIVFPARLPETIAVGASNNLDEVAEFSAGGPQLTLVAPGRDIYSTWDTDTDPNSYRFKSGTSFACPYVAATAALMRTVNPRLTPQQVRGILRTTADDIGPPGPDDASGAGRLNADRAVQLARHTPIDARPICRPDLNADGRLDFADLQLFLIFYAASDPAADLNHNGRADFYDLQAYLALYNQGCALTTDP